MSENFREKPFRVLATAYDYRPRMGGIATLGFELLKSLSSSPEFKIRLLAPSEAGAERFDVQSPIETRRIKVPRGIFGASASFARHLSSEIMTWKPDLILNFLWIPEGIGSYFAWAPRRLNGVPYWVYAHGVEIMESSVSWKRRFRNMLRPVKFGVFRSADHVLVNSRFTENLVSEKCGVRLDKIHVVHPGVDPTVFFPEAQAADLVQKYGLNGKKVFLTLTRLDDYKGIDHAILAMKQVIQRHPEAVYLVCGEGRDRNRLEKLIQEEKMSSHVIMVGSIPFDRVRDYYNLADVFVLLSREHVEPPDVEGFGIVFLEAAACSKPVIAGNSGGIPDAVEDGVSGWLVPPTEDDTIARAMCEAIENSEKSIERGRLARERVLSEFTWHHMADKVKKLITETYFENKS